MKTELVKLIARKLTWNPTTQDYIDQRENELTQIENEFLPHGSGINTGCKIVREIGGKLGYTDQKFVIESEYHHMDENGFYAGWFGFKVLVRSSLAWGYTVKIQLTYNDTDRSDSFIRDNYFDYLQEMFNCYLAGEVELPAYWPTR